MSNRFNAVGYSEKHLDDKGRFHFGYANIRDVSLGITEQEFSKGVRVVHYDMPSQIMLKDELDTTYYEVLDHDTWQILMDGDGSDIANDNYVSTKVRRDPWDPIREIY